MGAVIIMLDKVYTIGSEKLAAPHATMIKSLAEGVMEGNLPWSLILIGMGIAVAVWLMGGEVLPFSVGSVSADTPQRDDDDRLELSEE